MEGTRCPACGCEEHEGFECLVGFLGGQYVYLFYCDQCNFKHVTPRLA